ncbi:MAG: hypothetical protein FRX48_06662 [Lasallia pustulata]|uniref:Uncharacterized protein n=1 Tax=Lasallia pustulata TaxID=136370 RepID=A0A5M8PMF6_9LECA|nr:MAG: hypothetical protein FRX48_06662 [Lasallia pustulata]
MEVLLSLSQLGSRCVSTIAGQLHALPSLPAPPSIFSRIPQPSRLPKNIVSLALSLIFLYLLYEAFGLFSQARANTAHRIYIDQVNTTQHELQALLAQPISDEDFAGMGERIALFASILQTHVSDASLDRTSFHSLFQDYFPWWNPSHSTYTPWSSLSTASADNTTGIVMCAGSNNFLFAVQHIQTLRNVLHSTLPIQIAYAGDDDLHYSDRVILTSLGPNIETVNLLDHFHESVTGLKTGTWAQKPFAMLASRFQKVIIVDADTIFMQKPDKLFDEEPGLVGTGTLFYHDMARRQITDERQGWFHRLMEGREPSQMLNQSAFWSEGVFVEMESGVVCMDKGRPSVFMSLVFSSWMETEVVRKTVTGVHTHGDKETYWIAAELSNTPYHFNPEYAGKLGVLRNNLKNEQSVCGVHLLHLDSNRNPLWFNFSLRKNKGLEGSREMASFTHWVSGNATTRLEWEYEGVDRVWCAWGAEPHALEGTEYWDVLLEMRREAEKVDELYPDR